MIILIEVFYGRGYGSLVSVDECYQLLNLYIQTLFPAFELMVCSLTRLQKVHVYDRAVCCQNSFFILFINDLTFKIQAVGKGIDVNGEKITIFLYADAVVLLVENEEDLQCTLYFISMVWSNLYECELY